MAKSFYKGEGSQGGANVPAAPMFDIPGPKKAAILMVALGAEASSNIFKNLSEQEIEALTAQIARLEGVTPEMRELMKQQLKHMQAYAGTLQDRLIIWDFYKNEHKE